jgi:hypothetical protein
VRVELSASAARTHMLADLPSTLALPPAVPAPPPASGPEAPTATATATASPPPSAPNFGSPAHELFARRLAQAGQG